MISSLKRLSTWLLLGALSLPSFVLSEPLTSYFTFNSSSSRTAFEWNDSTEVANLILYDTFDNNASGWEFANATPNQWRPGFPSAILPEGEPNRGLYISDTEGEFSYSRETSAVSHAYKTIQLPEDINDITISFDWFCEGYADTDWMLMLTEPMDFMRVWLVPSSYTPLANQAITAENSGGISIKDDPYIENWTLSHENKTISLGDLAGQEIHIVFEWTNGTVGWPTRPAAVRNLKIDAIPCRPITTFPYFENFNISSASRYCWKITNQNEDHRTWVFKQNYAQNEEDEQVITDVASIYTLGSTGDNDDWLISPPIRLTGNQRLKYSYKVTDATKANSMQVKLANQSNRTTDFTQTLIPLREYTNTSFNEEVVELRNGNGELLVGEVYIAWHVPQGGPEGKEIMIAQVTVEDIPLCAPPTGITTTNSIIQWDDMTTAENWEIVIQPQGTGSPTSNGIRCDQPQYSIDHLPLNTSFEFYIRAKCNIASGQSVFSEWQGPNILRTPMTPVPLPYFESFEQNPIFTMINDSINQWKIGDAVSHGGERSLYIAREGQQENQYNIRTRQVSHVYKDILSPPTVRDISIAFDWRNMGETEADYFRVWLAPTSFTPVAGRRIQPIPNQIIQLNTRAYTNSEAFSHEHIIQDISHLSGQNKRLIFEWINDSQGGIQPPAAIDNLTIKVKHCTRPKNLHHSTITSNTALVSWTNASDVDYYDLYVSTTSTPPTDDVIPTHRQVSSPFTLTDLAPNTRYYTWVRSSCGNANKSFWISPTNFLTLQQPASLPFSDNFEGPLEWSTDIEAVNQWYLGTAVANNSRQSIYISSDEGATNQYMIDSTSISHIYRDIIIPEDAQEITISYDWHVEGEISRNNPKDYFRLVQVPLDTVPASNIKLSLGHRVKLIGASHYVHSNGWQREYAVLPVQEYQGETIRLVFEWINDEKRGSQSPAAIDNVNIVQSTCLSVTNTTAEIVRHTSNVRLSWTPQGDETKWEVYTTRQGAPSPTLETQGILVDGEPTLLLENIEEGEYFEYYVRALCEQNNQTSQSLWYGPTKFSYFLPPMCADLEGGIVDMPISETDTYILCENGPVTKQLEAFYTRSKTTDDYLVESIPYDPPFPFYGGDMIDLTQDDYWSPIIDLGFDFCFYGNTYNKVLIGINGMITFSVAGEVDGGRYIPESFSPWNFNQQIPFNPEENKAPFVNTIFGVMQDLAPNYSPEDYSVNYQVLGTFPCRALVFNIYHMGLFFNQYDAHDVENSTQTSQIVLYEGTNIIDIYVKNRPIAEDLGWGAHNGSRGILGIQNEDGTLAHYPGMYATDTINRNTGAWTAQNEAWRFTPNGTSAVDFKWYRDGEVYSDQEVIDVEITQSVNYTAKAIYRACQANELTITRSFNFIKQDFKLEYWEPLYFCGSLKDKNNVIEVDDLTLRNFVLDNLNNNHSQELDIQFYKDALATQPLNEIIAVKSKETVYVKVSQPNTDCFEIGSFDIIRIPPHILSTVQDIEACESTLLPPLQDGELYYTEPAGQGTMYYPGDSFTVLGESTLYIYNKNKWGCEVESSFNITIYPPLVADTIEDVLITCEDIYILPTLSKGNKYYTQPNGKGMELYPGLEIIDPSTIFIYSTQGVKQTICYDETSFTVSFEECPIPKGFSPNGDGHNDSFDLTNYGISNLQIFNRLGVEVYSHGRGYTNQWRGQDKSGNQLPTGTYYYIATSHGRQRTGWVQINY